MLATLGGSLALLLGVAVLLLPLLAPELSRPRDAVWGALVLLLGLVLVTSAERLSGSPMLAVLCGGLLIGRLGGEVGRGRWNQLSDEERQALATPQRWASGLEQLGASLAFLLRRSLELSSSLLAWLLERRRKPASGKRWVRPQDGDSTAVAAPAPDAPAAEAPAADAPAPEAPAAEAPAAETPTAAAPTADAPAAALEPTLAEAQEPAGLEKLEQAEVEVLDPPPPQRVVPDFTAIDALLEASGALPTEPAAATEAAQQTPAADDRQSSALAADAPLHDPSAEAGAAGAPKREAG